MLALAGHMSRAMLERYSDSHKGETAAPLYGGIERFFEAVLDPLRRVAVKQHACILLGWRTSSRRTKTATRKNAAVLLDSVRRRVAPRRLVT